MTKLRPCPFCGSTDVEISSSWVFCRQCEVDGPNLHHPQTNPRPSKEEVAAAWNERNPDPITVATMAIDICKQEVEKMIPPEVLAGMDSGSVWGRSLMEALKALK
jgi:hypothetical protein